MKNLKIKLADDVFENFIFGENIEIEGHDNWDSNDDEDFIKIVYISYTNESEKDSLKVSFHVMFDENNTVDDFYALDVKTGSEIGGGL